MYIYSQLNTHLSPTSLIFTKEGFPARHQQKRVEYTFHVFKWGKLRPIALQLMNFIKGRFLKLGNGAEFLHVVDSWSTRMTDPVSGIPSSNLHNDHSSPRHAGVSDVWRGSWPIYPTVKFSFNRIWVLEVMIKLKIDHCDGVIHHGWSFCSKGQATFCVKLINSFNFYDIMYFTKKIFVYQESEECLAIY